MHPVEAVLNRSFQNRRSELVLGKVGVEQQPVVAHLVPLAPLAALAHSPIEAGARQRVGDRVADVIQRQAAILIGMRLTTNQVRGFWAAWGGWALDGMDASIYAVVLAAAARLYRSAAECLQDFNF